ncbi:hypothetical protein WA026_006790 [Henosepilachna vigintioctopunctata]|uniref:Uncharacterized protein n=1 Tax=Henosepilachna vigintioctopunctata TaxID=420089 RepID=A0AAW1UB44_9CUCU
MKNEQAFDILVGAFSRGETNVINYLPYSCNEVQVDLTDGEPTIEKSTKIVLKVPLCKIQWPRICVNDYLNDADLKHLSALKEKKEIRAFLNARIPKTCKEPARILFKELMYTVVKFSRKNCFNLKQLGAIMSQFYLTHMIFTSSFNICAEKLYLYFKEIMLCHAVASPPDSLKLFSMDESRNIMNFFCKLYLRNLPIIRVMCLPNFAFHLNTVLEPETSIMKIKLPKVKGKKKKKKKKKK